MNAVRHGLLARTVVLQDEEPEPFQALLEALVARFRPVDDVELALVEEMAAAQWRKRRSWAIETTMMNDAAAKAGTGDAVARMTHAFTTLAAAPELALMHRYESRQTRMFQRALQNLLSIRKENLPNEPNPISEHQPSDIDQPTPETPASPDTHSPDDDDDPPPPAAPALRPSFDVLADFTVTALGPDLPPRGGPRRT